SDETRRNIVRWHFELGLEPSDVASLAGCNVRTVQRILTWHRDYDTIHNPFKLRNHGGRRRTLTSGDLVYITSILQAQPKTYLDELQHLLITHRRVEVSLSTLSRSLRRPAITNKKVSASAAERNELLRSTWQAAHGDIPAEYFVWLDEA
ncbi:hypothetical protein DFP72DRAFT_747838, partial [Ephemerocybe angulata]